MNRTPILRSILSQRSFCMNATREAMDFDVVYVGAGPQVVQLPGAHPFGLCSISYADLCQYGYCVAPRPRLRAVCLSLQCVFLFEGWKLS